MEALQLLNKKFNNKYDYLKLLSVVYEEETLNCTITFLYPFTLDEITLEDKTEIFDFYENLLKLNAQLKLKYKKSFLDSRLIIEALIEYLTENKKGILPYISPENIISKNENYDVSIILNLNQDVLSMIDELELSTEIKNYIEKNFIANIRVNIVENEEKLPDKIEFDDFPVVISSKARRYDVKIEKKLIGGDIMPKPEYIKDNKKPKDSVILGGIISNKNIKTFIQKKGKNAGKEKALYTFNLTDKDGGSIDCVYFCPKTHEKDMEALDNLFMIVCVGNIKYGLNGKLTYYIQKLSIATPIELIPKLETKEKQQYTHTKVVFPESIQRKQQANLFEVKNKYNDYITKNTFVVFDLETTGLDPEICEITEIGAVKVENGEVIERFASFAKTKNPIPEEVQQITHITDDMVKNAPRIEDVIYDFYEWSRGCIISGYNIVGFDMKFLNKVAKEIGLKFDNDIVDTYIIARQSSSLKLGIYKLGKVVKALGLSLVDAHRAYNDAHATANVLLELNKLK